MKVIDIKEYRKKVDKLKKLNETVDPLSKKMKEIENNKKLELKK